MGTNVTPWKSPFCYVFTLAYRWINIDWQRYTHVAFLAVEPDFAAIMTSVLIELAFFFSLLFYSLYATSVPRLFYRREPELE